MWTRLGYLTHQLSHKGRMVQPPRGTTAVHAMLREAYMEGCAGAGAGADAGAQAQARETELKQAGTAWGREDVLT